MKQSFPSQIEAVHQLQEALKTDLVKNIKYWFRVDSCYAMEKWGIDRKVFVDVLQTISNEDVLKYDFHHQDGNASVLVFRVWLLPSIKIDQFAYIKVGLTYNHHERITKIQILSFKEQDESLVFQLSDSEFKNQSEEIRASWLQVNPQLLFGIKPENLTSALIDCALKQAPELILQLEKKYLNGQRIAAAIYQQPELAFDISTELLSPAMILHVARFYPAIVECCPKILTADLVRKLVEQNIRTMIYLPKIYFAPQDYYQAALIEPELIQYVPQKMLTNELVDYTLQQNPTLIAYIPRQMKTMERCIMAVTYDATLQRYVPRHLKHKIESFFQ